MMLREVSASSLTLHPSLITMASSCIRHRDDCLLIFSEENEERDSANVVYKSLLL